MISRLAFAPALAFGLVVFLSLKGGGFEQTTWGTVGLAAWWAVAIALATGLANPARISRGQALAIGAGALLCCWFALTAIWSESAERTLIEATRVLSYLGVFVAACLFGLGREPRRAVIAIGAAIALIAGLAALSRFEPSLFPESDIPAFLPDASARLSYPLNYWNGLGALIAIGIPLVFHLAASSSLRTSVVAAAALPVMSIAAYMTLSRGAAIVIALAVIAYLALRHDRLQALPSLAIAGLGGGLLIALLNARGDLLDNLGTETAESQGHEMLALTVGVAALCALATFGLARLREGGRLDRARLAPPLARRLTIATLAALALVVVAGAATGEVGERWEEFKAPGFQADNTTSDRIQSVAGNGRYQYWESSLDAMATAPAGGIGPGTWEFWWAREGTFSGFVTNPHSLFFEILAEAGIIGFLLLVALFAVILGIALTRVLSAELRRTELAAIAAGLIAFTAGAAIDWSWQQPVLPVTFLLLASVALGRHGQPQPAVRTAAAPGTRAYALAAGAGLIVALLCVPALAAQSLASSRAAASSGELVEALDEAREAQALEPFSASAELQEALVLEHGGVLGPAASAAREAIDDEPTNWRGWFVLGEIEEARGRDEAADAAYEEARELNPRSPLFAEDPVTQE